jgi:undecaprenyl-diphosphatase
MNFVEAIVLGIIQGLTEFLPISSSGHLEIGKALFGNEVLGQESLFLTLVLHFGTALSTMVVFRKEIGEIIKDLFQFSINENTLFSFKIIISMIPAGLVGLTALILYLADRSKKTEKNVSFSNAFVLGIVQAVAILPGISRSGSTIATAVLLGVDKEKAARFSFIMVLPLIMGSIAKTILDLEGVPHQTDSVALFLGFIAAFLSGIFACQWMIAIVKKSKLKYFSYYCIIVGSLTLAYGLF